MNDGLLILHFWASWCLPCRREMHDLASFHETHYPELQQAGIRLLTVSNDLRREDLDRFLNDVSVMFPVYYDPLEVLQDRYKVPALPATVIVNQNGEIIDRLLGSQNWKDERFVEGLYEYIGPDFESAKMSLQGNFEP